MWAYSGPIDPDCASPEEFVKDEVSSRLDRVLQMRDKESLEGKPGPLHAVKLSNLVCSPLLIPCPFPSYSHLFLFRVVRFAGTRGRIQKPIV